MIREARHAKDYSQSDLADLLGYGSAQFISDWERGYAPIPMVRLTEISKLLEIDRDALFELLISFSKDRLEQDLREEYSRLGKRVRKK